MYTAITRARGLAVLVGSDAALAQAVRNDKVAERFSGLLDRLDEVYRASDVGTDQLDDSPCPDYT